MAFYNPGRALDPPAHEQAVELLFAGVRLWPEVSKRMRRRENALDLIFKIAQRSAVSIATG